jgi:hypothetical protein
MSIRITSILAVIILPIIYFTSSSFSGGVPGNASAGCSCHGSANTNTGISFSGLPTTYVNGTIYTITLNVSNSNLASATKKAGFTMSFSAGTLAAITGGQALSGTTVLYHNTPQSMSSTTASWQFTWQAPASGSANISISVSANVVNGDGSTGGDQWRTQTFSVAGPVAPVSVTATNTNIACNGGLSNITATASGGTTPYMYSLNGGAFQSSGTFMNNVAGVYTITARDNAFVTASTVRTITQPQIISITTNSVSNVSCNGGTNGAASISATGGTGSYIYSWAPSGGSAASTTNRPAGTYTVTVADVNSCIRTHTVVISQPTAITTSVASQTNLSCNGATNGAASITASGGTGTYTYSWLPSGGNAATASGLSAGTYTCTITDANNCTRTQTVVITQPTAISTSIASQTNVSCAGGANGAASITASGGTGTYTYSWVPSGGNAATASGLSAGTYTCTITDANNCTRTQTVVITQPSAISTSITSQTNVSCAGGSNGSATAFASGGTPSYTVNWLPSGGNAATASGLSAGTYSCVITDANNCTATQTVVITQPTAISTSITSQTNVSCAGGSNGSATAFASGGTPSYAVNWLPSGGNAATASGLSAGTYSCVITDANNCTATQTVVITQPIALSLSAPTITNVQCATATNGSAVTMAMGGTPLYTYLWMPGSISSATATNIGAGTYTCIVTDANSCTNTITAVVGISPIFTVSANANPSTFTPGNTITLSASSATSGTYSWAGPGGASATGATTTIVANANNAGTFTVTLTTATGCTNTATTNISIQNGISLPIKVLLSGPFNNINNLMNDDVRTLNLLPNQDPYLLNTAANPYSNIFVHANGGGAEVMDPGVSAISGNNAIVDWVFIELRSSANATQVVATRSALVQRDGDVVDMDGLSPVEFSNNAPANYFVAIRHRNHLGVMTQMPVAINTTSNVVDFTDINLALYVKPAPFNNPSFANASTKIINGKRALYAGNCNILSAETSKYITYNASSKSDRFALQLFVGNLSIVNGYSVFDCDLNGNAKFNGINPDRTVILQSVNFSNTALLQEQLP